MQGWMYGQFQFGKNSNKETLMICNYEKAKELHIYHTAFSVGVFMIIIIITAYVDKND